MSRFGDWYYRDTAKATTDPVTPIVALTANFKDAAFDFGGLLGALRMYPAGDFEYSWDGKHVHGEVKAADGVLYLSGIRKGKIWLRGTGPVRMMGQE